MNDTQVLEFLVACPKCKWDDYVNFAFSFDNWETSSDSAWLNLKSSQADCTECGHHYKVDLTGSLEVDIR